MTEAEHEAVGEMNRLFAFAELDLPDDEVWDDVLTSSPWHVLMRRTIVTHREGEVPAGT
jgi:hypothetical protein